MATKQLGMVVDTYRCIGCHSCAVACKVENNLPNDTWWNRTMTDGGEAQDSPNGVYPNVYRNYITLACQHCESPACTRVCPVGATYKDQDTGIVHQDYEKCIGCRMCIAACPYTGVRSFNWDEPKYRMDYPVGDKDVPAHKKHVVEKCTLCAHRLARGDEPACITACPPRARFFGDINEPTSEVSQLIARRENKQLLPEKGTNPSVYFLV